MQDCDIVSTPWTALQSQSHRHGETTKCTFQDVQLMNTTWKLDKQPVKILLLESVANTAIEKFRSENFDVEILQGSIDAEELVKKLRDVHVIGIRSSTILDRKILEEAKNLLCVGCFCIGTNQIDLEYSRKMAVPVFNSPYQNSRSVAELIIAMIICLARRVSDLNIEMHQNIWNKTAKDCHEVRGKVLGIVGYGHIGSQLSVLAESMGMKVIFYDIVMQMPMGNSMRADSLDGLLQRSDFVSLHVPQTPLTKDMIGRKEIEKMKPGAILLNASRGSVVVLSDLIEALNTGVLGGAFLDVYPEEPKKNGKASIFDQYPLPSNLIITPHIGGSTHEAQDAIGSEVSQRICNFIKTGNTSGSVNFPQLDMTSCYGIPTRRITNIHINRPGVLKEINRILSVYNVEGQMLKTMKDIGYFIADVSEPTLVEIAEKFKNVPYSIRTRFI